MYKPRTTMVKRLQWTDSTDPLMRIRYTGNDTTAHTAKIEILNIFGGTADIFGLTLTEGTTTYGFSGATATGSTNDTDVVTATLQACVDAINDLGTWEAQRLNGPADYSLNSNDFIALSETSINREWTDIAYRDVSEVVHASARIGIPEVDKRGRVAVGRIKGPISATTDATLYMSEDRGKSETDEKLLLQHAFAAVDGTVATPWDYTSSGQESWPVFNGPLLFEIKSSTAVAATTYVDILYAPVD